MTISIASTSHTRPRPRPPPVLSLTADTSHQRPTHCTSDPRLYFTPYTCHPRPHRLHFPSQDLKFYTSHYGSNPLLFHLRPYTLHILAWALHLTPPTLGLAPTPPTLGITPGPVYQRPFHITPPNQGLTSYTSTRRPNTFPLIPKALAPWTSQPRSCTSPGHSFRRAYWSEAAAT